MQGRRGGCRRPQEWYQLVCCVSDVLLDLAASARGRSSQSSDISALGGPSVPGHHQDGRRHAFYFHGSVATSVPAAYGFGEAAS